MEDWLLVIRAPGAVGLSDEGCSGQNQQEPGRVYNPHLPTSLPYPSLEGTRPILPWNRRTRRKTFRGAAKTGVPSLCPLSAQPLSLLGAAELRQGQPCGIGRAEGTG